MFEELTMMLLPRKGKCHRKTFCRLHLALPSATLGSMIEAEKHTNRATLYLEQRCTKSKILNPTPNPNPKNANPNPTPTPNKSKKYNPNPDPNPEN